MATIEKFRVVYAVGLHSSPARPTFAKYSPSQDTLGILAAAHSIAGVSMTSSAEDESIAVMKGGIVRGVGSSEIVGWEPSAGAALWCGEDGKPTTTRPTKGAQVFVGTYAGSGVVEVEVRVIPGLAELSFVKQETLAEYDVLIWDSAEAAFVPRQLDHGQDLAGTDDDDHPQYAMRRWSWLVGG